MATGVQSWSTTAASNSTADSNVNWAEGQAPSSVNDSARAMMASVAMWRSDTNGSIATGGTSTAYTITSNQSFASLSAMDNAVIAFIPHTTSGAAPTLAVDGLTAKGIRMQTATDLPSGVLIAGTPYVVTYEAGVGEFLLHNFAGNPWLVPLGSGMDYWGTTAPNSSFAFAYGQAISRTTYSTLFTLFGTTYGTGDGSTTFNLPDKRGRVVAGLDNMGGSDAGRLSSTYFGAVSGQDGNTLGHTGGAESHTLTTAQLASHTHTATDAGHTHTGTAASHTHVGPSGIFAGTTQTGATGGSAFTAPASPTDMSGTTTGASGALTLSVNSGTASITVNSAGSGSAHPVVQPTIAANYIIRII